MAALRMISLSALQILTAFAFASCSPLKKLEKQKSYLYRNVLNLVELREFPELEPSEAS